MTERKKFLLVSVVAPLLCWILSSLFFSLLSETRLRLETMLLDRMFVNREQFSQRNEGRVLSSDLGSLGLEQVVVVTIDQKTLETLPELEYFQTAAWEERNIESWPYDRRVTARAIERLDQFGSRVIGIDLLFVHPHHNAADNALEEAVRQAGNVVLASLFEQQSDQEQTLYKQPWKDLREAAASTGYVNVPLDTDGILRRILLNLNHAEQKVFPFALEVWKQHPLNQSFNLKDMEIQGTQARIPSTDGREKILHLAPDNTDHNPMLINFRGPAGTFPTISLVDLFDPSRKESLKKLFKGKIVLLGLNYPGLQDVYPTPFYSFNKETTPGVEIHANALFTLLTQSRPSIRIPHTALHASIGWGLGFLIAAMTCFGPLWGSLGFLLLSLGGTWVTANFLFASHILLDTPTLFLSLLLTYILALTLRMITRESEKATIRRVFNQYVSNQVVDELLMHPESLNLGGKALEITTLFSDIRSFTTISEQKTPEQVVYLLNTYFELMVSVITKHNGTINKFIGDAVMVLYGAPVLPQQTPQVMAQAAVKTAIEMQETLKASAQGDLKEIRMGIGISTGISVVGNIGAQKHKDYTAIGDKVNLAARLQGKSGSFEIIVDQKTRDYCEGLCEFEALEPFHVKGKEELIQAYRVQY